MKRFSIEWSGIITRDIGWAEVEAPTWEKAKENYLREHGQYRRVRSVLEIDEFGLGHEVKPTDQPKE